MVNQYFSELGGNVRFNYEFNDYVQEVERYGNDEMMTIAENQFYKSSKTVINLIHSNYNVWNYGMAMSMAIQIHLCFSRLLFVKKDDEILFYMRLYKDWLFYATGIDGKVENMKVPEINNVMCSFESSYVKQKNSIKNLIESISNDQEGWQLQWKKDCSEIADLYNIHNPNDKYLVYNSLVHMTNNRLGIHIRDESFIAFLIFKELERKFLGAE